MKPIKYIERSYKPVVIILMIAFSFTVSKSQDINYLNISSDENLIEINTERVKIKGCISLFGHHRSIIINDKTNFKSIVRKGANSKLAEDAFKKFDLKKQTVVGINVVSNQRRLSDLQYKTFEDKELKQYIIYLSYLTVTKSLEDLISHPVWFIIPKQKAGYEIKFCVDSKLML